MDDEIEVVFSETTVTLSGRRPKNIYRDQIWITKTGDLVPVKNMTNHHIRNILGMMDKDYFSMGFRKRSFWRSILLDEMNRREEQREEESKRPKRRIRLEEK